MKAKGLSLLAQLVGAVWIAAWTTYKFLSEMPTCHQIVATGLCIAACFSPVYFNLVMEKFAGRIKAKEEE